MSLGYKIKRLTRGTALALGTSLYLVTCGVPKTAVNLAVGGTYATAISDCVAYVSNLIPHDNETAVIVSSYDNSGLVPKWIPPQLVSIGINFFMYAPVTLRENIEGNNAFWFNDQNENQIFDTIASPEYQNLVLIGHGSKNSFCFDKRCITSSEIKERNIPKKEGQIVQYTCGNRYENETIADALLKDPNNIIHFHEEVWPHDIYFRAWKELGRSLNVFNDYYKY